MKYLFIPKSILQIDASTDSQIRTKFKNACALPFCRSSINTEIHHIVPKKEALVLFGDADYQPNLVLLCRQHHSEAEDNCITRDYLADIRKYWDAGSIFANSDILGNRYDVLKKQFDRKKTVSLGNLESFHEQIVYVNAVSLSTHIKTFQQNLNLLDKNIDPESAFEYYFSFASTYRRYSTQTIDQRKSAARLRQAEKYLQECERLIAANGLNEAFLNRVTYEEAYVRYLRNEDMPYQRLLVYEDLPDSFSNLVNRYFLYSIRADSQVEAELTNIENMYYYFCDHDQTYNNRWVFNSSTGLVEKRLLTNRFSDADLYLLEESINYANKEHYESSKSGVYKTKGIFFLKTDNHIEAATNLELSLSYATRFYSCEKISEIHFYLGTAYKKLGLFKHAAE